MTCHAAQCTVPAVIAVRWVSMVRGGRSRTEPVCLGHELALKRLIREHRGASTVVSWVSLARYEAMAAATVTVNVEDLLRAATW